LRFLHTSGRAGRSGLAFSFGVDRASPAGMSTDRVDFISAYCDRWCERCAFTSRCSACAVDRATGMCGDLAQGIEPAVGAPPPAGPEPAERLAWIEDLANVRLSAEEEPDLDRQERARQHTRVSAAPIFRRAWAYTMLSHRWVDHHSERLRASRDPLVVEALAVVSHDAALVVAKLQRALDGRDRHTHNPDGDDHPVQNDWNGSAKIALISLERSEAGWRAIAHATSDPVAFMLADGARDLHRLTFEEFPHAMSFVRPGFDEPWR
jgi:hypothetical protein